MNQNRRRFIVPLFLVAAAILFAVWLVGNNSGKFSYGVGTWLSHTVLLAITLIVHRLLVKAKNKRPQEFVLWYMGTITAKLLLSAILLMICGIFEPAHLWLTALSYLVAYFAYTALELRTLLSS